MSHRRSWGAVRPVRARIVEERRQSDPVQRHHTRKTRECWPQVGEPLESDVNDVCTMNGAELRPRPSMPPRTRHPRHWSGATSRGRSAPRVGSRRVRSPIDIELPPTPGTCAWRVRRPGSVCNSLEFHHVSERVGSRIEFDGFPVDSNARSSSMPFQLPASDAAVEPWGHARGPRRAALGHGQVPSRSNGRGSIESKATPMPWITSSLLSSASTRGVNISTATGQSPSATARLPTASRPETSASKRTSPVAASRTS